MARKGKRKKKSKSNPLDVLDKVGGAAERIGGAARGFIDPDSTKGGGGKRKRSRGKKQRDARELEMMRTPRETPKADGTKAVIIGGLGFAAVVAVVAVATSGKKKG